MVEKRRCACISRCVLLCRQFDVSTKKGQCAVGPFGCVLLGRQCYVSTKKHLKRGGAPCTPGAIGCVLFCKGSGVLFLSGVPFFGLNEF